MEPSRIEQQLNAIESRLLKIERQLGLAAAPPPPPPPPKTILPTVREMQNPGSSTGPGRAFYKEASAPAKPGNWLGIIAVVCFVLAAGFIIKLSIESGWLTPARQVGLAALLGLGLIGSGLALMRSDREYASLLPAGGVIVLYLTVCAAYLYYDLISFELAMAATTVVSALCIWLYTQLKHDIYALTAAVGAYVTPALVGVNAETVFSLYYFLLCSVAFATISIWVQSRILTLISAYLAILMTALVGADLGQDVVVASTLAIHFIIFAAGTFLYTRQNRIPLTQQEAWGFLPVLLLFYAVEYVYLERIVPGFAPWISLGFAAFLIGLYLTARKYFPEGLGSQSLIMAFATIVVFHSFYLEILTENARPWLFIGIVGVVAVFFPHKLSTARAGGIWRIPVLALFAVLGIEYITMLSHLLDPDGFYWIFVSIMAVGSLWALLIATDDKLTRQNQFGMGLLAAAHLLAIMALYQLTEDVGSLAVSVSWLAYAGAVMGLAFARRDEVMAKSALFVLGFAAAKALLYDAASAPTIVRILCLLLTGAALYGCGFLMRRIGEWGR